jgi:hypothetical protein
MPRNIASSTGSSDLQNIHVSLRILSRPDPNKLSLIYRTLGEDYAERVLPSIVSDESKAVVVFLDFTVFLFDILLLLLFYSILFLLFLILFYFLFFIFYPFGVLIF